jgi:hypothetical protein
MKGIPTWMAIGLFVLTPPAMAHDGPHAAGPNDQVFKISKTGEVKIGTDVRIGQALVKKGKYLAVHRVDGDSHVLALTTADAKKEIDVVTHEIRMRLIPSRDPVKASALFAEEQRDRSLRVVAVQIAGEPGDHVPEA